MTTLVDVMRQARADAYRESRILREAAGPPPAPSRLNLAYKVIVTCPRCGGPLTHITGSPQRRLGIESRAVAACASCRGDIVVTVSLSAPDPAPPRAPTGVIRHGTPAGYRAHRHRGEPACAACREAKRLDTAARRAVKRSTR